jgi:hypothetical protein
MFNWLVTIFMLASLIVLFAAWTRAIRAKDLVTSAAAQRQWISLRVLVFVALCVEVVLLILALIGAKIAFAWVAAIFLVFFSVILFMTVSYFLAELEERKSEPPAS